MPKGDNRIILHKFVKNEKIVFKYAKELIEKINQIYNDVSR